MSLHPARLATEELPSHQPADVHFCGESRGIDMQHKQFEFIVGDCCSINQEDGSIKIDFTPINIMIDGKIFPDMNMPVPELVTAYGLTTEQAYLMGKSLLMAAKINGLSE